MSKLQIIFKDNPIARAYLQCLKEKKLDKFHIIIIDKYGNNFLLRYLDYLNNNNYPIKYLKNKEVLEQIKIIESFFELPKNFLVNMYNSKLVNFFSKKTFITSGSINGEKIFNYFNATNNQNFLITHQEIVKSPLKTNNSFYHIHPGYLPEIRGADGSLHSIRLNNEFGCTFFRLHEKIDDGPIFFREKVTASNFKLKKINNFSDKDYYRFWFSFIDPALRASLLNKILDQDFNKLIALNDVNIKNSSYYTFMNKEELKKLFNKIFV